MSGKIYAGIGSRKTPAQVLDYMRRVASRFADLGFLLRSGAADGADSAFEEGCDSRVGIKEIWLPWPGFNKNFDSNVYPGNAHAELAATLHPAWSVLGVGPRKLHSRNVGQILGPDLLRPVDFVLCWTPDGCESESNRTRDTGGTGTAIVLASRRGIPIFNLKNDNAKGRLAGFVKSNYPEAN